jgi:drug/metabolite transporter (DMT)-like permease
MMAFKYISFSQATCITMLYPLLIPLFSACVSKERIIKWDILGLVMGLIGTILMI